MMTVTMKARRARAAVGEPRADDMLIAAECAAEIGCSVGTLNWYVHKGRWPRPDCVKARLRFWRRDTVEGALAALRAGVARGEYAGYRGQK
jgi:hypothetical protein